MKIKIQVPFHSGELSQQTDREHKKIHETYTQVALLLEELLPNNQQKEQSLLRLEESMMWAEKSVSFRHLSRIQCEKCKGWFLKGDMIQNLCFECKIGNYNND